jgi:hypothetical protein
MLEALCRQSSTTLDIVHAEDGPPITQRISGLGLSRIALTGHTQFARWKVRCCPSTQTLNPPEHDQNE